MIIKYLDFQCLLALCDAFGFRPETPDWYLDYRDEPDFSRWWYHIDDSRLKFTEYDFSLFFDSLQSAEEWLAQSAGGVPDSADLGSGEKFYKLHYFLRRPSTLTQVQLLKSLTLQGGLRWRYENGNMVLSSEP